MTWDADETFVLLSMLTGDNAVVAVVVVADVSSLTSADAVAGCNLGCLSSGVGSKAGLNGC